MVPMFTKLSPNAAKLIHFDSLSPLKIPPSQVFTLRVPAIACLPAFGGGSLSRLFFPLCRPCAWSRASNLATKALAFPISYLGTNVTLHYAQ